MPVTKNNSRPVSFTPDTCSRVDINVPCTIQSVDITTIIQNLQTQIETLKGKVAELERKTAGLS